MDNQKNIYDEYQEILKEIIDEMVEQKLKDSNFFRALTGVVIHEYDNGNSYDVDIIDTKLSKVSNKTGQKIPIGATVTILERYGSNYSNCYISIINGNNNKIFWSTDGGEDNSITANPKSLVVQDSSGNSYAITFNEEE